jgi:hypothetical protein
MAQQKYTNISGKTPKLLYSKHNRDIKTSVVLRNKLQFLYAFISVFNATLFTITPLFKLKLNCPTCFGYLQAAVHLLECYTVLDLTFKYSNAFHFL